MHSEKFGDNAYFVDLSDDLKFFSTFNVFDLHDDHPLDNAPTIIIARGRALSPWGGIYVIEHLVSRRKENIDLCYSWKSLNSISKHFAILTCFNLGFS